MIRVNCPSCSAFIEFKSAASVSAVCGHCNTLIVRRDADIETIGTVASLPYDLSPIMVGTSGKFRKKLFDVVGRRRMAWRDGGWNEWQLRLSADEVAVLVEAQGRWIFCVDASDAQPAPNLKKSLREIQAMLGDPPPLPGDIDRLANFVESNSVLGNMVTTHESSFSINDVKIATCISAEGELIDELHLNERVICLDALDVDGNFLSLELSKNDLFCSIGWHAEWQDLKIQRARPLTGWEITHDAG